MGNGSDLNKKTGIDGFYKPSIPVLFSGKAARNRRLLIYLVHSVPGGFLGLGALFHVLGHFI